jgi:23S rRNA (adenine2503-C2)-methyltransferase
MEFKTRFSEDQKMKIASRSSFAYPADDSRMWEGGVFQPLIDHKFRLLLSDGNAIEAAAFELSVRGRKEVHACISTQAGCKFGCVMCTSGKNGFARNLSDAEIRGQVEVLSESLSIPKFDQIVFMGIGEPLDNYDNFVESVDEIIKREPFYSGRLSLATVGLPAKLLRLLREPLPPFRMLWISLHAATNEKRYRIMPIEKAFSIDRVLSAAQEFAQSVSTKVWINYMLFKGFNDAEEDVQALADLLEGTEDFFSVMITEPNNDLPFCKGADILDLRCFEVSLREYGVRNEIGRFMAAGKRVNAGCGEFIFTPAPLQ